MLQTQGPGRTPVGVTGQDRAELEAEDWLLQQEAQPDTAEDPPGAPEGESPPPTAPGLLGQGQRNVRRLLAGGKALAKGAARGANEFLRAGSQLQANAWHPDDYGDEEYRKKWDAWWDAGSPTPFDGLIGEREAGIYGLIEGIGQVAAVMGTAYVGAGAAGLTGTTRLISSGVVGDLAGFDPSEARMADLLNDYGLVPGPLKPLTEFLEADPEDTPLEGRTKNALEGLVFSGTLSGFIGSIRAARGTAKAVDGIGDVGTVPIDISKRDLPQWQKAREEVQRMIDEAVDKSPVEVRHTPKEAALAEANPHFWRKGADTERAQAFDALPDEAEVWVFHATDDATAESFLKNGVDPDAKPTNLTRQAFEDGDADVPFQPGRGAGKGVYVGTDPFEVSGYGRRFLAIKVNKGSLAVPPEQAGLGRHSSGEALVVNDAMVASRIDPANVRDVTGAGPNAHAAEALADEGAEGFTVSVKADRAAQLDQEIPTRTFQNQIEAERHAAEIEMVFDLRGTPDIVLDEATKLKLREDASVLIEAARNGDEAAINRYFENDHFNFARMETLAETKFFMSALTDNIDEAITQARHLSDGSGKYTKNLIRQIKRIVGNTPEQVLLRNIQRLAGTTEKLPAAVLATRVALAGKVNRVARLNKAWQMGYDSPTLTRMLSAELDEVANFAVALAGTASNIGRALQQFGIHVSDEWALNAAESLPKAADEGAPAVLKGADNAPAGKAKDTVLAAEETAKSKLQEKMDKFLVWDEADPWNTRWGKDGIKARPFTELFRNGDLTTRELQAISRTLEAAGNDPKAMLRALQLVSDEALISARQVVNGEEVARLADGSNVHENVLTFRASMMLSGPATHAVNLLSGVVNFSYLSVERMFMGMWMRDSTVIREGIDRLATPIANIAYTLGDAIHWTKRSWQAGDQLLDPAGTKWGEQQALQSLKAVNASPVHNLYNALIGLPFRLLMTEDQFMKRAIYTTETRVRSISAFRRENGLSGFSKMTPEQRIALNERVQDDLLYSTDVTGAAIRKDGLVASKTATFTDDFEPNSWQAQASALIDNSPGDVLKHIFPFKKVPINITSFSARRTPLLNNLSKQRQRMLASGDPRQIAEVRAQTTMGALVMSSAGMLAWGGYITGRGPADPRVRKQLMDGKWKPYTIRIPGTDFEMEYRRLEPIATPLALMADLVTYGGEYFGDGDMGMSEASGAILAGMGQSALDKTFTIGMVDAFEAIGSGNPTVAQRWFDNYLATYTPAFLHQTNPDPVWREVTGVMDRLNSRVPGLSLKLEPRRNTWGEAMLKSTREVFAEETFGETLLGWSNQMSPFRLGNQANRDDVTMALSYLGTVLQKPEKKMDGSGIKLTDRERWNPGGEMDRQSPYDRWGELMYESGVRDEIADILGMRDASQINEADLRAIDGRTMDRIEALYTGTRQRTFKTLLSEYPKLQAEIRDYQQGRRDHPLEKNSNILRTLNR